MANEAKIKVTAEDDASATLTRIGKRAKEMRGAFLGLAAVGGAVAGAIGLSVAAFAKTGDEIQKMGLRTGFTTVALSELKFALEQSGSNIEGFEKGIRRMSSFVQDGRDGLLETTRAMDSLGLSVDDFTGKTPEQSFDILAKSLAGVEDAMTQSALAQDIFGRSGTALIPLLKQGAEGIAALRQEAHDLGIVFDEDAAAAAARLVDAQNTLTKSMDGVKFAIAEGLAPAISGIAEKLGGIISKVSEFARENPVLTKTVVALGLGLAGLALGIGLIGLALPVMTAGLAAVSIGFIGLNIATGGLLLGIAALVTGIVLLATNWDTVVEAIRKGSNIVLGGVEKMVNGIIGALNWAIKKINAVGQAFGVTIGEIADIEMPRWEAAVKTASDAVIDSNDGVIDSNDELGISYTKVAETAEQAAKRIIEASSQRVKDAITASQEMSAIDLRLADSEAAATEAKVARLIQNIDLEIALDRGLGEALLSRQEKSLLADLKIFKTRSDAVEALLTDQGSAFDALLAGAMALPSNIAAPTLGTGIGLGTGRDQATIKDAGSNVFFDPETGRLVARTVTGGFTFLGPAPGTGGLTTADPEGAAIAAASITALNARLGGTVIIQGDVYGFDDFADKVAEANQELANQGVAQVVV